MKKHFIDTLSLLEEYAPPDDLLKDRVILVTGASSGMGRISAKAFAKYGATVILLGKNIKKLETLYDEIEAAGCAKPAIYPFNLKTATPKDYDDLSEIVRENFGRLDGLLHNAAILGTLTPIIHYPVDQWFDVLQVNLNSVFLLTKATLPLLKCAKEARIVFTSAPEGIEGKAYFGAYGVSKFGVNGLMQTLSRELAQNTPIRVNSIHPIALKTALRASAYPAESIDTLVDPQDLVPLYLYLMGPDSQTVQGQVFRVPRSLKKLLPDIIPL